MCINVSQDAPQGIKRASSACAVACILRHPPLGGRGCNTCKQKKWVGQRHDIWLCYTFEMNCRLKFFLMWFLICLVPLQGIAAPMRPPCGPEHQLASSFGNTATPGVGDNAQHHGTMMHAHAAPADTSQTTTEHGRAHQHKNAFCGTCGSCCIGAFAPPLKIDWELPATKVSIDIVSPAPLVTGYIPNGLERPPRYAPA